MSGVLRPSRRKLPVLRRAHQKRGLAAVGAAVLIAGAGLIGLGATAANAAPGQAFTYITVLFDENGDYVALPSDQPWEITAVGGGSTYSNQDPDQGNPFGLVVDDPAAGTYTVTVDPYQDGLVSSDLVCNQFDANDPETQANPVVLTPGGSAAAGWQIPVSGTLSTTCVESFVAGEPLPDPRFEAVVNVEGGVGADGSPAVTGDETDFQVALEDSSGTLHLVNAGESISVAPGEYTPVVIAAQDAQPGFDINQWTPTTWYCVGMEGFAPGGTITLAEGTLTTCATSMVNADVDLSLSGDVVGDVDLAFGGLSGAVGTEFEIELVLKNADNSLLASSSAVPVGVLVTLGDNMAVRDPFVETEGFTATLDESTGQYLITADEELQPGASATIRLSLVLTGTAPSAPFEACLVIPDGLVDHSGSDNCFTAEAVADGEPIEPSPKPIESVTPTPVETTSPAPTDTPSTTPDASVIESPASTDAAPADDGSLDDAESDSGLAQTGANIAPIIALTTALVAAGALLVTMQKRREQRS